MRGNPYLADILFQINDRTLKVFASTGGKALAQTTFSSTTTTRDAALAKLCADNNLTGDLTALDTGLFGNEGELVHFTATVPAPPIEITLR